MTSVTASEFQKNFGKYRELAQRGPVSVTSNGRDSVVVLSVADYRDLLERNNATRFAYGGEVTEEFKRDVARLMDEHDGVLAALAKR